jgi:hypothetical protein
MQEKDGSQVNISTAVEVQIHDNPSFANCNDFMVEKLLK